MRWTVFLARAIFGPLIRKVDDEYPGSGCLIIIILIVIALLCAFLGIGDYR